MRPLFLIAALCMVAGSVRAQAIPDGVHLHNIWIYGSIAEMRQDCDRMADLAAATEMLLMLDACFAASSQECHDKIGTAFMKEEREWHRIGGCFIGLRLVRETSYGGLAYKP